MKKISKWFSDNLSWLVVLGVAILCTLFIVFGSKSENGYITLDGKDAVIEEATKEYIESAKIEYGKQVKALLNIDGTEEEIDVQTVELVDGGNLSDDTYTGLGMYAPIDSVKAFKDYTLGKCFNVDGAYGAQCWDLGALFWTNYTGRSLNTCGTGAAKGTIQDGCWQKNAGSEFTMIWNAKDLQAGDWVITKGGTWGHVFMALGNYNNGYISALGQNQGGTACSGGGSATNIINMSLKDFAGAFRPKIYEKQDPTPTPIPTPVSGDVVKYTYVYGDYFSGVLIKLNLDEGHLWGENGTVRYYTKQLIQQNMLDSNGNVKVGIPFELRKK